MRLLHCVEQQQADPVTHPVASETVTASLGRLAPSSLYATYSMPARQQQSGEVGPFINSTCCPVAAHLQNKVSPKKKLRKQTS